MHAALIIQLKAFLLNEILMSRLIHIFEGIIVFALAFAEFKTLFLSSDNNILFNV